MKINLQEKKDICIEQRKFYIDRINKISVEHLVQHKNKATISSRRGNTCGKS